MFRTKHFWMIGAIIVLVLSVGWQTSDQSTTSVEFGKIYLRDNLLLVSELTEGIRVLDITNPTLPSNLGLISIEGNHDMACASSNQGQNLYLYADAGPHLVVYDISDPRQPNFIDTIFNIFQQAYIMDWGGRPSPMPTPIAYNRSEGGFFGCTEREYTVAQPTTDEAFYTSDVRAMGPGGSGRGGSMARFAVVDDYLYCIDYNQLYVFDIATPSQPRYVSRVNIGWGIETLFPYQNYLFIGGQNGMFVYSRSNPKKPEYVSTFQHIRSCDPVVVEDSIAYVTLRGGTRCGTVVSALHLVNIKDLMQPKLITSYPLPQPMGLDVSQRIAYVCDDSTGVVILDTEHPANIRELSRITGANGYDAIKSNWMLIISSRSNISFYNVSNPRSPMFVGRYGS